LVTVIEPRRTLVIVQVTFSPAATVTDCEEPFAVPSPEHDVVTT
jgi:hypothetical protein